MADGAGGVKVFLSYAHKDEDLRDALDEALGALKHERIIEVWWDRKILPGAEWSDEIIRELEAADLALLLVSPAFLNSPYCYEEEMRRAVERHQAGTARVVPIIMRPCHWEPAPFAKLQGLPKDMKPVTKWRDRDAVLADVAAAIHRVAKELAGDTGEEPNIRPDSPADQTSCKEDAGNEANARLDEIRQSIVQALLQSKAAMEALNMRPSADPADREKRAADVADALIKTAKEDIGAFLKKAKEAHKKLSGRGQHSDISAVRDIVHRIVPRLSNEATINWMRIRRSDVGYAILLIPAAKATVAEIIMAGADDRSLHFKLRKSRDEWPEGEFVLPLPPESGRQHVSQDYQKYIEDHLIQKYQKKDKELGISRKDLIKAVSRTLSVRSEEDNETWYAILKLPDDLKERQLAEEPIRALKQQFPAIVFLELNRDGEIFDREESLYYPLRDIQPFGGEDGT